MDTSSLAEIINFPDNPIELLQQIVQHFTGNEITMNLATLDDEFGILNRTVNFRGIIDDCIVHVTQHYTRNCKNLKTLPKAAITFHFPQLNFPEQAHNGNYTIWQIRLMGVTATPLNETELAKLWTEEPLFAKIRAYICNCGEPINFETLKAEHERVYGEYKQGKIKLDQPKSYTAFKYDAERWDFYKGADFTIADRVQYRKKPDGKTWEVMHIAT